MINVNKIVNTCYACPAQWEGITDENRQIYIRYRWGYLSVRVGNFDDMNEFAAVRGQELIGLHYGDGLDGLLSYEELKNLIKDKVILPSHDNFELDWQD